MSANPDWQQDAPEFSLRRMCSADLDAVHALETFAYAFPWSKGSFRDCLKSGYENWLLVRAGTIIGYGILFIGVCEGHILNICVHPEHRRQHLGRYLLRHLVHQADIRGALQMILEVRPGNQAARNMYSEEGFRQIGLRPGYYPGRNGREDALVLALDIEPQLRTEDDAP